MSDYMSREQADDEFFAALTAGDVSRLEPLLDDRFLIVDVMSGAVADRAALLAALDERILEFGHVELIERAARHYGDTAILVGRTQMAGSFSGRACTSRRRSSSRSRGCATGGRIPARSSPPTTGPPLR
jgi:hypothetical protein